MLNYYLAKITRIFKTKSQDQVIVAMRNLENTPLDNILPTVTNRTDGFPDFRKLFEGGRVILKSNVDINNGLLNGVSDLSLDYLVSVLPRSEVRDRYSDCSDQNS